jgi:hypothetical protein
VASTQNPTWLSSKDVDPSLSGMPVPRSQWDEFMRRDGKSGPGHWPVISGDGTVKLTVWEPG